jgi:hypothetical protein
MSFLGLGDASSGDNSKSAVARIGSRGQKFTDPLAWIFGDKYTGALEDIADKSNELFSKVTKPAGEIDKKINPVRKIPFVDKVATWTENKPVDTAAIVAGTVAGGAALAGGGAAGGAGGAGAVTEGAGGIGSSIGGLAGETSFITGAGSGTSAIGGGGLVSSEVGLGTTGIGTGGTSIATNLGVGSGLSGGAYGAGAEAAPAGSDWAGALQKGGDLMQKFSRSQGSQRPQLSNVSAIGGDTQGTTVAQGITRLDSNAMGDASAWLNRYGSNQ